jgi:hypothetical protein
VAFYTISFPRSLGICQETLRTRPTTTTLQLVHGFQHTGINTTREVNVGEFASCKNGL